MKQTIKRNLRTQVKLKTPLLPAVLWLCFSFQPASFAGDHEHEGHEETALEFSAEELQEFDIKLAQAKSGKISKSLELTGEVIVAPERLYHVVPWVSGVVRQVYKHLGEQVKNGDLLAILSSRELAAAKAQYVTADSLLRLADTNLQRETKLYKENITAKRNYLKAKQEQAEMSIKRKAAKQQLLALGLSETSISAVLQDVNKDLTRYELRAPADGVIIDKHAVYSELITTDTRSFTIADLSEIWVNLTVYQKDLALIHLGQPVRVGSRFGGAETEAAAVGTLSWMSPTLDEKTRSATARVVLENADGRWRPGMFVSGNVVIAEHDAALVIPLSALQTLEGKTVVFVRHEDGDFEPQPVQTGRRDFKNVEILQGLKPGQTYVSQNAFSLKAQLQKGEFGEGHHH